MNETLKINPVNPIKETENYTLYSLYDYSTKEMIECYDRTPELPIYLVENPETKEPLYFKFIPSYDYNYGITKEGILISFKSRHINTVTNPNYPLKIRIKKTTLSGNVLKYKSLTLSHNGVPQFHYIHSLVLETWVGLPSDMNPDLSDMLTPPECNHKDNNPLNNDYTNLEWCDRYYNNSHRIPPEEWGFHHTLEFNQKQLVKLRTKMNDLIEENEELILEDTEINEKKFNKNQQIIDSIQFQLEELEFTVYQQLQEKYESQFKEVV